MSSFYKNILSNKTPLVASIFKAAMLISSPLTSRQFARPQQ